MTDSDKLKAESSNLAEYLSKASESLRLVEDLKKTVEIDNQEYILSSFDIHPARKGCKETYILKGLMPILKTSFFTVKTFVKLQCANS